MTPPKARKPPKAQHTPEAAEAATETPESAEQATGPLLTLSTVDPKRDTVDIDGSLYELRLLSDMGIVDQHRLHREGAEFDELWKKDKLSDAEGKRLKFLLDRLLPAILDAPPSVRKRLDDAASSAVVLTFLWAPLAKAVAQQTKQRQEEARPSSTTES